MLLTSTPQQTPPNHPKLFISYNPPLPHHNHNSPIINNNQSSNMNSRAIKQHFGIQGTLLFQSESEQETPKTKQERKLILRREQFAVSVRKERRRVDFQKWRQMNIMEAKQNNEKELDDLGEFVRDHKNTSKEVERLVTVIQDKGSTEDQLERAITRLKRILILTGQAQYITRILDEGLLPIIVKNCMQKANEKLQKQACWLLACLSAGNRLQVRRLMITNILDVIVELLKLGSLNVIEQTVWILANIAGDCEEYRRMIYTSTAIMEKLADPMEIKSIKLIQRFCWLFSNLTKGQKPPNFKYFKKVFYELVEFMRLKDLSEEGLNNLLKAISTLTLKSEKGRQRFVKSQILSQVRIRLLSETFLPKDPQNKVLLIRLYGNLIASSNMEVVEEALKGGFMKVVCTFLQDHFEREVCKEVCWALSNLVAGPEEHASMVFKNEILMGYLLDIKRNGLRDVRRHAGWVFRNLAETLHPTQIYQFYKDNKITTLYIDFLNNDQDLLSVDVGIEGLKSVFLMADHFAVGGINPLLDRYANDFYVYMKKLTESENEEVAERAEEFIRLFNIVEVGREAK